MDKLLKQSLLYDFYGEMLTEHQRLIYEDFVLNDYSLSEIAQDHEISRQGVYDIIKRCTKQLETYEAKLHLIEKFDIIKHKVQEIESRSGHLLSTGHYEREAYDELESIKKLASEIIDEY